MKAAEQEFLQFVDDESFPCLGARSAAACGNLRVIEARNLRARHHLEVYRGAVADVHQAMARAENGDGAEPARPLV